MMSLLFGLNEHHRLAFGNNWRRFLLLGILISILGLVVIAAAEFTTLLSVVFLGFVIFLSGLVIATDTFTFWRGKWTGFLLHFILAVLYLLVGITLIAHPVAGAISLTLILGIFYIITGVMRIGFTSLLQTPHWGWGWLNGLITLILGILILNSWPVSSLFIIGLFVGIDLFFCGWTYIMAALAARKLQ